MAYSYGRVSATDKQPPIIRELEALFNAIPDAELLETLRGNLHRRGPKGYDVRILWHSFLTLYYLGLPCVSDLIRCLQDNPHIARACGIESPDLIPSQPTFSRFFAKVSNFWKSADIRKVHHELTRRLYASLPGFGEVVAIDSTDIKAWSHGKHQGCKTSDADAGWCVKSNTEGNKKYVYGYKTHILCDTRYELPISFDVTSGNVHDVTRAQALLAQARYAYPRFNPKYVVADAGYSSDELRRLVSRHYHSVAVIDPNASHKKAYAREIQTADLKAVYRKRTSIERLNGRLKEFRRLGHVRVRGRRKVFLHAMLAIIVCQAQALSTGTRTCVRKVTSKRV